MTRMRRCIFLDLGCRRKISAVEKVKSLTVLNVVAIAGTLVGRGDHIPQSSRVERGNQLEAYQATLALNLARIDMC